jgi:hypothetical protein
LPAKTEKPPVLICKTLVNNEAQEAASAKPTHITWDTEGIVARLCAAAQVAELSEDKADTKLAKSLALKYQLVTQHTNLFLLHERAEGSKAEGLPKLQQVAQMQAAGWSGHGSVIRSDSLILACRTSFSEESYDDSLYAAQHSLGGDYGRLNTPSVWRTNRTAAASKVDGMSSAGMDDIEIPAFLRKQADISGEFAQSSSTSHTEPDAIQASGPSLVHQVAKFIQNLISPSKATKDKPASQAAPKDEDVWPTEPAHAEASLDDIANTFNTASLQATSFRVALQQTLKIDMPQHYAQFIIELTKHTQDSATSWALLFQWLFGSNEEMSLLDRHALRLLRSQLQLATTDMQDAAHALIHSRLVIVN